MSKDPIKKIRRLRRGRPADVKNVALRYMHRVLETTLRESHLISKHVPVFVVKAEARAIADKLWEALNEKGVNIVSATVLAEVSLLINHVPHVEDSIATPARSDLHHAHHAAAIANENIHEDQRRRTGSDQAAPEVPPPADQAQGAD